MKIGITLSGGLSKGAYQFGFIKALLEYIPYEDIKIVSGSSIGLVNAYGLCAKKMDEVEKIWKDADYDNIWQVIHDCWHNHFISKTFKELVVPGDKLYIPFYTTMTYIPLIGRYYLLEDNYSKKWNKLFRAAIGFPIITGWPHFYKGWLTMDGGAFDNIPIYPLIEQHDLDLIICIHFDSQYIQRKKWHKKKTVIVDLDASFGNSLRSQSFNFSQEVLSRMLEAGYNYGEKICKKLFESGYGNIDGIRQSALDIHESEFEERMKNGTIDKLVTTLNDFSQLFRGKHSVKKLIKKKVE